MPNSKSTHRQAREKAPQDLSGTNHYCGAMSLQCPVRTKWLNDSRDKETRVSGNKRPTWHTTASTHGPWDTSTPSNGGDSLLSWSHAFCHMVFHPFCKDPALESWPNQLSFSVLLPPSWPKPWALGGFGRTEIKLPLQCPSKLALMSMIVYLCHICTGRGSPKCSLPVCATCLAASRPEGVLRVRMSTFYLPVRAAQCFSLQALRNRFYAVCRVCDLSYAG